MRDALTGTSPRHQFNIVATGAFFGVLQWCTFFLLQSYLSSTAIVYLLATSVWLLGSLAGLLHVGREREGWWLAAAAGSYFALLGVARTNPYDLRLLPLLLLFVAGMGAYAGRFFRYRGQSGVNSKWLFFLENSGFVGGMILTVGLLFWAGESVLVIAPATGAVICSITLPRRTS